MDGRRHSVDLPISKALVALRRVRSLRDPSTNSMSKFSPLADNLSWEANPTNAITFGLKNDSWRAEDKVLEWRNSASFMEDRQIVSDYELYYGSTKCRSGLLSPKTLSGILGDRVASRVEVHEDKFLSKKFCKSYGGNGLEKICMTPAASFEEGGDSCEEPEEISSHADKEPCCDSECKVWNRKFETMSGVTGENVMSFPGSPCLSSSKAPKQLSSYGTPLYRNEDVSFMGSCHQGCGISSCWLRSMKSKDSDLFRDVEEQPLLIGNSGQLLKERLNSRLNGMESPRNLCQKYMPKSFKELVGQDAIAASLLTAISHRKITSLYLFHGPSGTGKTSASRIFAAALNCLSPQISRPCGICQECIMFFSGRSRDAKEVDPARINKMGCGRSFIKNAGTPPILSRFKVYIVNECHLLHRETWTTLLNCLDELPPYVVLIMLTPSLDKLPRAAISKAQKYHFHKVKEVDIARRLGKICIVEGLEFEEDALSFIAKKSSGSLWDAEMMLDQLSLLGRKITVSLVHEINGVVSDAELIDLLGLAFSSDASNTVKKARELMGSRIDPLQLVAQLANLIVDIVAGKRPDGVSEVGMKLFGADISEANMQQLSHALNILSQTEKQLRASKNQITWLTAALLQLSSTRSSHSAGDAQLNMKSFELQDGDFQSTSSTSDSLKVPVPYACEDVESQRMELQDDKEMLELVWKRATGTCTSTSLKKFLQKRGKLISIRLAHDAGIAVAELEFDRHDYVSKAEKSWKLIAGALQHILGYNVELRINLSQNASNRHTKSKKSYLSLFNCSRRMHLRSDLAAECRGNASDNLHSTPPRIPTGDKYVEKCSSDCRSQFLQPCCHGKGLLKMIRNHDGNALTTDNGASRKERAEAETNRGHLQSVSSKPETKHRIRREFMKFHCWRSTTFPFRKAWQMRHRARIDRLVDYDEHFAPATV